MKNEKEILEYFNGVELDETTACTMAGLLSLKGHLTSKVEERIFSRIRKSGVSTNDFDDFVAWFEGDTVSEAMDALVDLSKSYCVHEMVLPILDKAFADIEKVLDAVNEVFSKQPTPTFKVGDKVRIKKERVGLEWTIVEVIMPTEEKKAVQYKLVRPSEEEGRRVVLCVRGGKIEKVEEVKQEPKFKVGDWVRNDKGEVLKIDGIIPFVYMTGTDFIYYVKEGSTYLECELGFYAPKEGEFTVAMRGNNNPHGDSIMCYSKPHATIDTASWFSYMVDSDESLYFGDWTNQIESHRPATEEEKQTLIKAVEEGYNKTYCEETKEWVDVKERSYDPAAPEGMKFDDKKPRMDLLPFDSLEEVAKVLTFGAKKYAPNNWQKVEDGEDRYTAALMRHLTAHKNGETYDKDSGLSHLSHVACNALFLVHFLNRGEQCD